MKILSTLLLGFALLCSNATAGTPLDFVVENIEIPANGFIHLKLTNRSGSSLKITPRLMEKTFVTIYINNIRRAEYKIKYLDRRLFQPQGRILLRTNFRVQGQQRIKIVCNPQRIIKETNYTNNTLERIIRPNGK